MGKSYIQEETQEDRQLMINNIKSKKHIYYGVLILLGLLNNLGFVLVNSSAQTLGKQFGQESLMSLFTFCLTSLGIVTSFYNSKYLLKMRHYNKIKITVMCYTIAYMCVGISNLLSNQFGFILCLFGSVIMGVSATLGEQTNVGFLKGFAPELISAWGCGTGVAGVFGAGINFLLRYINISGYMIFLCMIPTNFLYLTGFAWLKDQKVKQVEEVELKILNLEAVTEDNVNGYTEVSQDRDQQEAEINQALSLENFERLWPIIWTLSFNLALVYFLEFTIIIAFADKATDQYMDSNVGVEKNSFILLNLCYQIGVLVSKSSLALFKIRQVWILTALQFVNFFLWAWIAYTKLVSLPIMFILMIWVGLMGGASFVNVIYLILEGDKPERKDKELSISIVGMINSVSILMTSLLSLVLQNTIYKYK